MSEVGRLGAADVTVLRQGFERGKRAPLPQWLVALAMHELEQLHRELDIAQTGRPELELIMDFVVRDVVGDAFAHALDGLDEVLPRRAGPYPGREGIHVAL